jgi:asparagine synthase (glutamine-hydrolysing)
MCGIAGLIMKNGRTPPLAALEAMQRALAHRGPDGVGSYVKGAVGFVQTRLAIIDVAGGDHPLYGPGGSALVGNGEIYNYVELRRDQAGRVNYRTQSDFEPTLSMLEAEGLAALAKLRGMYGLAQHRPWKDDVLLARDPFGIKPLYRLETERLLAFASEPRAFFAAGLAKPAIEPLRRDEFLELQYANTADTVFAGIRRILPGEGLRIVGGAVVETRRIDPLPPPGEAAPAPTLAEAIDAFDRVFQDSVLVHQRSDVPYGMFLSGGTDSAAVLAVMARLNERPVLAFTCGFAGTEAADEREQAAAVARACGAEHVKVEFGAADFWRLLPDIAGAFDDPTADYAILPTYKLGAEARKRVKVVLSGEGGDEVLAGYGRYRYLLRPWWRFGRAPRVKGMFERLGVLRNERRDWAAAGEAAAAAEWRNGRTKLQSAQAVDIRGWLPHDLLLKLDRALMAHGVEGRTPFLDPEVVRFAFPLPDNFKVAENHGKWILRQWLAKHCPAAAAMGRKRGFTVPVGEWIAAEGSRIGPLVAGQEAIREVARPEAVTRLFKDGAKKHPRAAFTLLFYALWHRRHIEGADGEGGAFDVLAASA